MIFNVRLIKRITDSNGIIGDYIGELEVPSIPPITSTIKVGKNKYTVQSISHEQDSSFQTRQKTINVL